VENGCPIDIKESLRVAKGECGKYLDEKTVDDVKKLLTMMKKLLKMWIGE